MKPVEWDKLNKSVSLPYLCRYKHRAAECVWLVVGTLGHLVLGKFWMRLGRRCGSLPIAPKESLEHVKQLHCRFFMLLFVFFPPVFHLFHPLPFPPTPKAGSGVIGAVHLEEVRNKIFLGGFFSQEGQDVPALHHCCPVSS